MSKRYTFLDYNSDYEVPVERAKYKAVSEVSGLPWVNIFGDGSAGAM